MKVNGKKLGIKSPEVRMLMILAASGLWEQPYAGGSYGSVISSREKIDWESLFQLARSQAISGLVAAGLECFHLSSSDRHRESIAEITLPQKKALARRIYSVQRANTRMDGFLARLHSFLKKNGITPVLLKGQGLAQCYIKPLHRASGDIDLLLDGEDYVKAKELLTPLAKKVCAEDTSDRHLQMIIKRDVLELHGSLHVHLTKKTDIILDRIQEELFQKHLFRTWTLNPAADLQADEPIKVEAQEVLLPEQTRDVLYVFCHILQHLFNMGIGLKQVCDLARLLYTFRNDLDVPFLESRLQEMGLIPSWKVLAALLKDYLGMNPEYIPFYDSSPRYSRKAKRLLEYIIYAGNMGKNRDVSYRKKYPYLLKKMNSMWLILCNAVRLGRIFPGYAFKITCKDLSEGVGDLTEGI